jgi:hypothetical protein
MAMAKEHARARFDFDVEHGVALDLGEVADLGLGKADVFQLARRQALHGTLDGGVRQAEVLRLPVVELPAVFANGRIAARLDVADDAFNGVADGGIVVGARLNVAATLEVTNHGNFRVGLCIRMQSSFLAFVCKLGDFPEKPCLAAP